MGLLFILLAQHGFCQVEAQNATAYAIQNFSGTVLNEKGESLPGVNVWLKGSTKGTISDKDGKFVFPVVLKTGDVLSFSFVGLKTEEYTISKSSPENITINLFVDMSMPIVCAPNIDKPYTTEKTGIRKVWAKIESLF